MFETIVNILCTLIVISLIFIFRWYLRSQKIFDKERDDIFDKLKYEYNEEVKILCKVKEERENIKNTFNVLKKRMQDSLDTLKKVKVLVIEECKKNMKKESLRIEQEYKKNILRISEVKLIEQISSDEKYKFYDTIDISKII